MTNSQAKRLEQLRNDPSQAPVADYVIKDNGVLAIIFSDGRSSYTTQVTKRGRIIED